MRRTQRLAAIALATASSVLGAGALADGALADGAPADAGRTHYAKIKHVCPPPRPRHASCLADELVPAAAGAGGGSAYEAGAGAAATGPAGGLTPGDLASAYKFSRTGGSGQTVAIVDAFDDPNVEADLATFDAQYGLPACTTANGCFEKVGQTGSRSALPQADTRGWSVEIALDVETVHGVCPNCKVVLVEASSEDFADLGAATDEAVNLGASEVSNSYGGLEGSVGEAELAAYNHPGVVIVAAGGDSGYLNWDFVAESGVAPAVPDVPASLPSVVSVGGTSLKLTSTGTRKSETVWNDSGRPSREELKRFSAGGGGCSTAYSAPAWQQSTPAWGSSACAGKRLDNDVGAVADPYTGFDIYDSYVFEAQFEPGWLTVGGTSLSSPLIAALYGLAGGGHGQAYPAAALYSHVGQTSALYDVTKGGNGYCDGEEPSACGEPSLNELLGEVDCEGTTACDAGSTFDGPTGVGTPSGLGAFTMPPPSKPAVLTEPANPVHETSAVLNATVDPDGSNVTACTFEYGPTSTLGHSIPCSALPGAGVYPVAVAAEVSGLTASTTYYFRIRATNAFGSVHGASKKLLTP